MKPKLLVTVSILAIALQASAEDKASLMLRLHDESGAPIANARVSLIGNSKGWAGKGIAAPPDSKPGQYSSTVLPGVYDVFVSAPCFVPIALQVRLSAGAQTALSELMKLQEQTQGDYVSDGCPAPFALP